MAILAVLLTALTLASPAKAGCETILDRDKRRECFALNPVVQDRPDPMLSVARVFNDVLNFGSSDFELLGDKYAAIHCEGRNKACALRITETADTKCVFTAVNSRGAVVASIDFRKITSRYLTQGLNAASHSVTFFGQDQAVCKWDRWSEQDPYAPGAIFKEKVPLRCFGTVVFGNIRREYDKTDRAIRAMAYIQQTICPALFLQPY